MSNIYSTQNIEIHQSLLSPTILLSNNQKNTSFNNKRKKNDYHTYANCLNKYDPYSKEEQEHDTNITNIQSILTHNIPLKHSRYTHSILSTINPQQNSNQFRAETPAYNKFIQSHNNTNTVDKASFDVKVKQTYIPCNLAFYKHEPKVHSKNTHTAELSLSQTQIPTSGIYVTHSKPEMPTYRSQTPTNSHNSLSKKAHFPSHKPDSADLLTTKYITSPQTSQSTYREGKQPRMHFLTFHKPKHQMHAPINMLHVQYIPKALATLNNYKTQLTNLIQKTPPKLEVSKSSDGTVKIPVEISVHPLLFEIAEFAYDFVYRFERLILRTFVFFATCLSLAFALPKILASSANQTKLQAKQYTTIFLLFIPLIITLVLPY